VARVSTGSQKGPENFLIPSAKPVKKIEKFSINPKGFSSRHSGPKVWRRGKSQRRSGDGTMRQKNKKNIPNFFVEKANKWMQSLFK